MATVGIKLPRPNDRAHYQPTVLCILGLKQERTSTRPQVRLQRIGLHSMAMRFKLNFCTIVSLDDAGDLQSAQARSESAFIV